MRIRTKLIVAFLAVALAPVALLSVLNQRTLRRALTDAANRGLMTAAAQAAGRIDGFVTAGLDSVRVEAQLPELGAFLVLPPAERAASSAPYRRTMASLVALSRKNQFFISSYGLLDRDGRNVIDTQASRIGEDESHRGYFEAAVGGSLPYVSPTVLAGETSLDAGFFFSCAVRDAEQRPVGVLRVRYKAAALQELIIRSARQTGPVALALLVDEGFALLAHSAHPGLVFTPATELRPDIAAELQEKGRLSRATPQPPTWLNNLGRGLSGAPAHPYFTFKASAAGNDLHFAAATTPLATRPWRVVLAQPRSTFLAPVAVQIRDTLALALIVCSAVLAAAVVVGGLLARPVVHLRGVADRVAKGDLAATASADSRDEIGELGATFNRMTGELQRSNRRLEEATREAEGARKRAESASLAKTQFLANMSHEIRTPLNAISGMTTLALKTELSGKQRGYLTNVLSAAHLLAEIINDILDMAKIEADKLEMRTERFDLDKVLTKLEGIVGARASVKGLQVVFTTGRDVPRALVGDSLRLSQILINLLNNAIKFTETGEIVLTVDRVASEADGVRLRFSVRDPGIGIPEHRIPTLFEPFTQLDGSMTRRYEGAGLGLSICARLVSMMQGELSVESEPGQGSTFSFTAVFGSPDEESSKRGPTARVLQDARAPVVSDIFPSGEVQASFAAGLHLLVVEDNRINRDVAEGLLVSAGFEVTTAADGMEAIRALDGGTFDAVLLDIQMPRMDGVEATRLLRADPRFHDLPIIAMTAHAMADDRGRFLDAGMTDYVAKPIDESELLGVLSRWLPRREPAVAPGTSKAIAPSRLPELPGIAAADGLRRVGGSPELFSQLVLDFCEDFAGEARTLREMLEREDTSQALEKLHTLKGVAGNLGMQAVAAAAAAMEETLRESGDWAGQLELLDARLEDVLEGAAALRRPRPDDEIARDE